MNLNKRDFLKWGGATTGAALVSGHFVSCSHSGPPRTPPRGIIFLVSDGMSGGVVSLAEYFSRMTRGKGTRWWKWLRDPSVTQSIMEVSSLNSLVTDSAAASSAWGTGSKVFNRYINMLPDGRKLDPIGPIAMRQGWKFGLVTTARITHATPAGFAASVLHRDMEDEIASQYYRQKLDLLMGGGLYHFLPDCREDGTDLLSEFTQSGYTFLGQKSDLDKMGSAEKVLGLFEYNHLPFTLDQRQDADLQAKIPTLADMTRSSLEWISRSGAPFLLQIEGARIDHAAHCNDIAGLLWDQLAFDDAIVAAEDFAANRDDILIVVTTDHGNSNPGVNGIGGNYELSSRYFETSSKYTMTLSQLNATLKGQVARGKLPTSALLKEMFERHYQVQLEDSQAKALADTYKMIEPSETSLQRRNFYGLAGQILGNHNGVGWTGTTHTSDLCPLLAKGAGSSDWSGFLQNTDVFRRLSGYMGSQVVNPFLTYEQSLAHLAETEKVRDSSWVSEKKPCCETQ